MKTIVGIVCTCLSFAVMGCSVREDSPKNTPVLPPEYVKVEVFGELTVVVFGFGDGAPVYIITANGQTWELNFHKDDNLILRAKELDGQRVWVRGTPELAQKVERGIVLTILVDDLKDISHVLPKKQ